MSKSKEKVRKYSVLPYERYKDIMQNHTRENFTPPGTIPLPRRASDVGDDVTPGSDDRARENPPPPGEYIRDKTKDKDDSRNTNANKDDKDPDNEEIDERDGDKKKEKKGGGDQTNQDFSWYDVWQTF